LLCSAIRRLCDSPEAYILVRSRFAKSYAAFNIGGYILGIGDRHLMNYLLSTSDGAIVGIDFGYSFGQGAVLRIPELVPFRMTRQFSSLLRPLDSDGLIKQDMTLILQELRAHRDVLLSVLEVFVQEPLLEWQMEMTKKGDDTKWLPKKKVRVAKMKLEGVHPSVVMLKDIEQNARWRKGMKFQNTVRRLLYGKYSVPGREERLRSAKGNFAPCEKASDQVELLVDLATDKVLLGRMWIGWSPYI